MSNSKVPLLKPIYTRIDILDIKKDNPNVFERKSSIYFIDEKIKGEFSLKNSELVKSIGISNIKALMKDDTKYGGDDFDDWDDMDFEEILNSDESIKINSTTRKDIKLSGSYIVDTLIYETDKINDLQFKIYNCLSKLGHKIEPEKQYLWLPEHNISMDGDEISLMDYWHLSIHKIEGYPVDGRRSGNVSFSLKKLGIQTMIIELVSLDSIINDKGVLQLMARSDPQSLDLIHSNLVQRFFPSMSMYNFELYITNKWVTLTRIDDNFKNRENLIKNLSKYKKVSVDNSDIMTTSTVKITIENVRNASEFVKIDLINIFKKTKMTDIDMVSYIDLFTHNSDKEFVRVRKLIEKDKFQESQIISEDDDINSKGIFYGVFTKRNFDDTTIIYKLVDTNEYKSGLLIISSSGQVIIKASPVESLSFSKKQFISLLGNHLIVLFNYINNLANTTVVKKLTTNTGDLSIDYAVPMSSSKLIFSYPVSFKKMLNIIATYLIPSGILGLGQMAKGSRSNIFPLLYGTDLTDEVIEILSIGDICTAVIHNVDLDEAELYVDIFGRILQAYKNDLYVKLSDTDKLAAIDPILFRSNVYKDTYSRICQRKFQPVIAESTDKNAVKYKNFTFGTDQYYKCPSKEYPNLGLINGHHMQGFCLPCCRKNNQANFEQVKQDCMNEIEQDKVSNHSYKIDYPIDTTPNIKIINRRITPPEYLTNLLELPNTVFNGGLLEAHGGIRDGSKAGAKTYLQTATIIAASFNDGLDDYKKIKYNNDRELILDLISLIKDPRLESKILSIKIIRDRFETINDLLTAFIDRFLHMNPISGTCIVRTCDTLSAIEWNDLVISLSNIIGYNVLLLEDNRDGNGISILNINDINPNKYVLILLRRINKEWAQKNHNTRAAYIPLTKSTYKSRKDYELSIDRLYLPISLKRITKFVLVNNTPKDLYDFLGFNEDGINKIVSTSKIVKVDSFNEKDNICLLKIGKSNPKIIAVTMRSPAINEALEFKKYKITGTITDALIFIDLVNAKVKEIIKNGSNICALKIKYKDAEEIVFVNDKTIPATLKNIKITNWLYNPINVSVKATCNDQLQKALSLGQYYDTLYKRVVINCIDLWKTERLEEFDIFIIKELKKVGEPPINQSLIDSFIKSIMAKFPRFDEFVVGLIFTKFFNVVNSTDKNNKHIIDRFKEDTGFKGFGLINAFKFSRNEMEERIEFLMSKVCEKVKSLDTKTEKIKVLSNIYNDIFHSFVSDMLNPFRRDYLINLKLIDSIIDDVVPHIGEIIYIRKV